MSDHNEQPSPPQMQPPQMPPQMPLPPPPPQWGAQHGAPQPGTYQQYPIGYGVPQAKSPYESRAVTILVLGILGLTFCQLLGPVAFFMGRSLKAEAEAAGWPEPSTNSAGRICGLIATIIMGVMLAGFLAFVVVGLATSTSR